MMQSLKLFMYDIKIILKDRKNILLLCLLTLIIATISLSFCYLFQNDKTSIMEQFQSVSKITDKTLFISYVIYIFSFIIFSTYPFIIGIVIISYIKEFGELELMMLFPINRKAFFIEKILSVFTLSYAFCLVGIIITSLIQQIILSTSILINKYVLFYTFVSLPCWIFFVSCTAILISSLAKDTKEANQKSLILPFVLYILAQALFILKIDFFSKLIIFIPLAISIVGSTLIFIYQRNKITIEKILYNINN